MSEVDQLKKELQQHKEVIKTRIDKLNICNRKILENNKYIEDLVKERNLIVLRMGEEKQQLIDEINSLTIKLRQNILKTKRVEESERDLKLHLEYMEKSLIGSDRLNDWFRAVYNTQNEKIKYLSQQLDALKYKNK